jgi:hypothetical protein
LELDRTRTIIDPISGAPLGRSRVLRPLSQVNIDWPLSGVLAIAIVDTSGAMCESSYNVTVARELSD